MSIWPPCHWSPFFFSVTQGLPVHLSTSKQQQWADPSDQQCHQEWPVQPQPHLHVSGTSLHCECGKPRDGWGLCQRDPSHPGRRVSVTSAFKCWRSFGFLCVAMCDKANTLLSLVITVTSHNCCWCNYDALQWHDGQRETVSCPLSAAAI